jgi:DNA repair protein RadC
VETGQLEIFQNTGRFLENGVINFEKYASFEAERINHALEQGYEGIRYIADLTWFGKSDWNAAIKRRTKLHQRFPGLHFIGISAYPLSKLDAGEFLKVVHSVKYLFISRHGKLSLLEKNDHHTSETFKRKEAEYLTQISRFKKLSIEENNYLDNAAVILLAIDPEGKVSHINNKGCKILGYRKKEIIGKNWFDNFIPPDLKKELLSLFGKLLSSDINVPAYHENPVLTKEGDKRTIAWHCTVIRDSRGNAICSYSTGIDTTEQDRMRETRKKLLMPSVKSTFTSLQEKYIDTGLQELNDREILELKFSQYMTPAAARKLAKTCIAQFGTLRELLAAPVPNLQIIGIPRACIFALKLIHELPFRILKEEIMDKPVYESSQDVFNYLNYSMRDLKNEVCKVIYLNDRNQIIDVVDLYSGTSDSISLNARSVIEKALEKESKKLIFVHNHPSGDPIPSQADKRLTRDLVFVGSILQINILDHIIIGDSRYFSFASEGLIREYELDYLNLRLTGTTEAHTRLHNAQKKE